MNRMNQQNSSNQNPLDAMLKMTAQRMGTTPEALKQAAESGDLSRMLGNMNQQESAAMEKVLSDPEAAKKLLSTPQAQKLLKLLGGQGTGK